jgi:L-threonylcarbamoyladenylate synthase
MQPSARIIIDADHPDPGSIREAARVLGTGGLIIVPTETVYGLAASADRPDAEEAIYTAKGRDPRKPIPLLAADIDAVVRFGARFTPRARRVAELYWPGALTLVLPVGDRWEGFRVPDHAVARAVAAAAGGVLRVTSANLSGAPPAVTAAQAEVALGGRVDLILDAGACRWNQASTVVKAAEDRWILLREGVVPWADIEAIQ